MACGEAIIVLKLDIMYGSECDTLCDKCILNKNGISFVTNCIAPSWIALRRRERREAGAGFFLCS